MKLLPDTFPRPTWQPCNDRRFSHCPTHALRNLDWLNWWQGDGFLQVRGISPQHGEAWHRVTPRFAVANANVRIAVRAGMPFWVLGGGE